MNEQEIRKFCDDVSYDFVAGLIFEPEFENLTCKAMRVLCEGLKNSLLISIHEFTDKEGGEQ
jgi:hypothetical protein